MPWLNVRVPPYSSEHNLPYANTSHFSASSFSGVDRHLKSRLENVLVITIPLALLHHAY